MMDPDLNTMEFFLPIKFIEYNYTAMLVICSCTKMFKNSINWTQISRIFLTVLHDAVLYCYY